MSFINYADGQDGRDFAAMKQQLNEIKKEINTTKVNLIGKRSVY